MCPPSPSPSPSSSPTQPPPLRGGSQRRVVLTHLTRPSTHDDDGASPSRRPLLATPTAPHPPSLTHPAVARAHTLSCCLALALSSPSCHLPPLACAPPCLVPRPHVPLTPSLAHPPLAISPVLGTRCHHTDPRPHIPLASPIYPALKSLSRHHSPIPLDGHTPPRPLLLRAISPTPVPAPPHMAPSPSRPSLRHRSSTPPSQEHPRPRAASPS